MRLREKHGNFMTLPNALNRLRGLGEVGMWNESMDGSVRWCGSRGTPRKGYTKGNDLPSENEMELAEALLRGGLWVSQDERSVH